MSHHHLLLLLSSSSSSSRGCHSDASRDRAETRRTRRLVSPPAQRTVCNTHTFSCQYSQYWLELLTRKLSAQCRHITRPTRPSTLLLDSTYVYLKRELKVHFCTAPLLVCPGWLVNTDTRLRHFREVFDVQWPSSLTFWTQNLDTVSRAHLHESVFLHLFVFELGARRTGRTDGRARPVMRPVRTAG